MHLLITDSGLGGLSVCATAERALRAPAPKPGAGSPEPVRITYFNAWPEAEGGYNDMPDIASRARAFDRALSAMADLEPDRIVIACNTLSVVYAHTAFSQSAAIPVTGILDAGVDLFREALGANPCGSIVLFGTRTTIESDVHRTRLIEKGVDPARIGTVACHGLARAIETDVEGTAVGDLIERCTATAASAATVGDPLYFGVCCTHYTYVKEEMRAALERRTGRAVRTLDPGDRLVAQLVQLTGQTGRLPTTDYGLRVGGHGGPPLPVPVSVVSKVAMDDRKRQSMASRVEAVSPVTAAALRAYTRVPDLF